MECKEVEREISSFLIRFAKFEYFLISKKNEIAMVDGGDQLCRVNGVNWGTVAKLLEEKHKFSGFDFSKTKFFFLKENSPQLLCFQLGNLKWDSDSPTIDSWERLLTRSFAQLRNNIAHGSKSHLPAQFTSERTRQFVIASTGLIEFIALEIMQDKNWEEPIYFS